MPSEVCYDEVADATLRGIKYDKCFTGAACKGNSLACLSGARLSKALARTALLPKRLGTVESSAKA